MISMTTMISMISSSLTQSQAELSRYNQCRTHIPIRNRAIRKPGGHLQDYIKSGRRYDTDVISSVEHTLFQWETHPGSVFMFLVWCPVPCDAWPCSLQHNACDFVRNKDPNHKSVIRAVNNVFSAAGNLESTSPETVEQRHRHHFLVFNPCSLR